MQTDTHQTGQRQFASADPVPHATLFNTKLQVTSLTQCVTELNFSLGAPNTLALVHF